MIWGIDRTAGALLVAASLAVATPAAAATNLGFETGDLTGWTTGGNLSSGVTTSYGAFSPVEGSFFGYVQGGTQDIFTTLSQDFVLAAGQSLSGSVGFRANDVYQDSGTIYNDSGYLKISGTTLFSSDVQTVGDFGNSGWVPFSFTAATAGTYTLEIGAANHGDSDSSFASGVVLDAVTVSRVSGTPEPGTWLLLVGGFGVVGTVARSRRPQVARA